MLRKARRTDLSDRAGRPDGVIYRQQYVRCGNMASVAARQLALVTDRIGMGTTGIINSVRGASTSASTCRAASRCSPIQPFRLMLTRRRANRSIPNRRIPVEPESLASS